MKLSSYCSDYKHQRSIIIRILWYVINAVFFYSLIPFPSRLKRYLLRVFGASVGSNVIIKPRVYIKFPWLLSVGNDVWIGEEVWIDNLGFVNISNDVCISQGAKLLTGSHNYSSNSFDLIVGDILVEQGAWLCADSIVCPGIKVGRYSVLSVGSVATQDLRDDTIYQGNPATIKRKRLFI